jgi:D-glycero-alpha-D-manno-heptose-7-phosphate kinase
LKKNDYKELEERLLLAYCGARHRSSDINSKWLKQFIVGKERYLWGEIVSSTKAFVKALGVKDWASAVDAMHKEVAVRRKMTPEVFDKMGDSLVISAMSHDCGARFTGAGGGGCIWALGEPEDIGQLRSAWMDLLSRKKGAKVLTAKVDAKGLEVRSY